MPGLTTKSSQSTTYRSQISTLAELFPNPTLVKVLSLFLLHPEKEFYQRGIAASTGNALLQVQRALKRIERAGLVTKTRRGNMLYYQADRLHPAFEDLQRVFLKTVALGDVLREALAPLGDKAQTGFHLRLAGPGEGNCSKRYRPLFSGPVIFTGDDQTLGPSGIRGGPGN